MSAEGNPQNERSILARLLVGVARWATGYPRLTLAIGVLLAIASIVFAATRMRYHTSRAALISSRCPFHQRWLEYTKEFGEAEDVVIVVEGKGREAIAPVVREIADRVGREKRFFFSVFHDDVDLTPLRAKGLHYLPLASLEAIDRMLDEISPVLQGDWSLLSPGAMAGALASGMARMSGPEGGIPAAAEEMAAGVQRGLGPLCDLLSAAFDPSGRYRSPWPDLPDSMGAAAPSLAPGLHPGSDRFGFVVLKLHEDKSSSFAQNAEAIALLRRIVAEARARHPEVSIGLTGLPIMEHDEMQSSQNSTIVASVLEAGGLVLVLVAGFGGLRHSLLAMTSLAFGMVWSFGYVALTIGHLNILSSAFGAILIGLGTNYGIYSVARYLYLRARRLRTDEALEDTAATVAPGITVGAATTAIAFFVAGFTDFPGVAELGVVAGGGILLCWLAAVTVLPALVHLVDRKASRRPVPVPLDFHLWIRPLVARPRRVIAIGMGITALLGLGITRLWYDHNLLHLQPAGLESVQWEERLLAEMSQGAWFAVSMADTPEELAARKAAFLRLPTVDRVDEIASLLPADEDRKLPLIRRIAHRLRDLPDQPPRIAIPRQEQLLPVLHRLRAALAGWPTAAGAARELAALEETMGQMAPAEYYAKLSGYLDRAARELLDRLHALRDAAHPSPPDWNDLPAGLVDRFVGRSGKLLLRVYGKGSLWDMDAMARFVADVRGVDPKATGNPMQVYEASRQMKRSYEQAALYAILIIVPLVFLDFRRPRDTFLAVLPLGLGMFQLFGLMGLLNVPLNAANIIALPLMLGMAIDNGVHIMHDFHGQRGRYRMSHATAIAVVLDSVTTMVGFAVLMVADHRGLQGLGRVMTIGMACCLFSSLIILPAILALMTQGREEERESLPAFEPNVAEEASDEPENAQITLAPALARRADPERAPPSVAVRPSRSARPSIRRAA